MKKMNDTRDRLLRIIVNHTCDSEDCSSEEIFQGELTNNEN